MSGERLSAETVRLTGSERMRLAGAVYSHTSHPPPLGEYDLSSVLNPVERMVEQLVRERLARVEALAHSWAEDDDKDPAYALWLLAALGDSDAMSLPPGSERGGDV